MHHIVLMPIIFQPIEHMRDAVRVHGNAPKPRPILGIPRPRNGRKRELLPTLEAAIANVPRVGGKPFNVTQVIHALLAYPAVFHVFLAFLNALVSLLEVVLEFFWFQYHVALAIC